MGLAPIDARRSASDVLAGVSLFMSEEADGRVQVGNSAAPLLENAHAGGRSWATEAPRRLSGDVTCSCSASSRFAASVAAGLLFSRQNDSCMVQALHVDSGPVMQ